MPYHRALITFDSTLKMYMTQANSREDNIVA